MRFSPLLFIVFVQFLALVGIARYAAPTTDEWGHLPSGLVHWIHGSFVPYRDNPPFVRMIASAPVLLADYQILAISRYDVLPGDRNEFRLGEAFAMANGDKSLDLFFIARIPIIFICCMGTILIYVIGSSLHGNRCGLFAAILYALSPMILTYGAMITPDSTLTVMGLAASWSISAALRNTTVRNIFACCLANTFAVLCKTSWIVVLLALAMIVLYKLLTSIWSRDLKRLSRILLAVLGTTFCSLLLVGCCYNFTEMFWKLVDFPFVSSSLVSAAKTNRFEGSILGNIPIPFPRDLVLGIDQQRWDFEGN